MENLHWENHNNSTFNVFIRDLSQNMNINLKHMIEDHDIDQTKINKNKNEKNKKNKPLKKKDIIILEQNKKREEKKENEDIQKIEFLFKNLTDNNIYDNFHLLKTEKGKQNYKLRLLIHFMEKQKEKKHDYMPHILNLYFNMKYGKNEYIINDEIYIKKSLKIDKQLTNYDYKTYMMKELSHLLPPLNFWNKDELKLDDWQINVINLIKKKQSILVKAPTSSGKTFVAMATGLIHNKILYVCPAKPVVYQVGANFIKMGYKVHYLVENMGHLSFDQRTNIFIGTPDIIEKYLPRIYTDFDYAVFDEIHNIDNNISYENIIKIINCNFLALSATIENINFLKDLFHKIHPNKEINYVEYKKRFINQQRWIYNDKLEKVHPIICINYDNLDSINNITFTPNDCIVLYERLEEEFEDIDEDLIDEISPDNYFKQDKLLTLDDTKEYESFLKNEIKNIYRKYPNEIENVISSFKKYKLNEQKDICNIIPFFKECKKNDLLPMLYFHTDQEISKEIFLHVYNKLKESEIFDYPYHYDILEKKNDLYKKFIEKRRVYSDNIKIKTKDAHTEKREKMARYDKEQKDRYISEMSDYYLKCISKCKDNDNSVVQIENLKREYENFIVNPDFREHDVFRKHPDYCFSNGEPMSGDEIRSIRREIKKSIGINIVYENPLFQLLKRGIGLYISSMPDEYNWILQRLMSEKKLGIIISDRTLCLGIDLPIRSVSLTGYKNPNYTVSDYLQMTGRAGRRGHDNQGNIIFHGVSNYLELMKGDLPKLNGSNKKIGDTYSVITDINKNINIDNLSWRINGENNEINKMNITPKLYKLSWNLRYYDKSIIFLEKIAKIEKIFFRIDEDDREYWLYNFVLENLFDIDSEEYFMIYKKNKIENNIQMTLSKLIKISEVFRSMVNSLDNTFMITKRYSNIIFLNLRTLIYKYRGLE